MIPPQRPPRSTPVSLGAVPDGPVHVTTSFYFVSYPYHARVALWLGNWLRAYADRRKRMTRV